LNTLIQNIVNAADTSAADEFEAMVNRSSAVQLQKASGALTGSTMPKNKSMAYSALLVECNDLETEMQKMVDAKAQINLAMLYHTMLPFASYAWH
jgi:hypothetical protein